MSGLTMAHLPSMMMMASAGMQVGTGIGGMVHGQEDDAVVAVGEPVKEVDELLLVHQLPLSGDTEADYAAAGFEEATHLGFEINAFPWRRLKQLGGVGAHDGTGNIAALVHGGKRFRIAQHHEVGPVQLLNDLPARPGFTAAFHPVDEVDAIEAEGGQEA